MSGFRDPSEEIRRHGVKLPHWQQSDSMQFVTFRLADAMPLEKLGQWKEEHAMWMTRHPKHWSPEMEKDYQKRFIWKIEHWLDEGRGSCLLSEETERSLLAETLMHDEGTRAENHAWVIMPNHVHLLFTAHHPLEQLMKSWKGISARKNRARPHLAKGLSRHHDPRQRALRQFRPLHPPESRQFETRHLHPVGEPAGFGN